MEGEQNNHVTYIAHIMQYAQLRYSLPVVGRACHPLDSCFSFVAGVATRPAPRHLSFE
jgi:hypothetical protein